ncbi:MAG: hypothetical protein WC413_01445 [Candidatus Nanoarchaeia archaeon]
MSTSQDFGPYEDAYKAIQIACKNYLKENKIKALLPFAPVDYVIKQLESSGLSCNGDANWNVVLGRLESMNKITESKINGLEGKVIISLVNIL